MLKVGFELLFLVFVMNTRLIRYRYTDIKNLHTEISSLTRIIDEKHASTGFQITFYENHGRPTLVKRCQISRKQKCSFFKHHDSSLRYIDIKKIHTEISSLTRTIHEKHASTGSRARFGEKTWSTKKTIKQRGCADFVFCQISNSLITRLLEGRNTSKKNYPPRIDHFLAAHIVTRLH